MEMDIDISLPAASPEERERMVRNFATWLDRALEEEQLPEGLTSELLRALRNGEPLPPLEEAHSSDQGSDLYSLWSAMTALAQEVRMQGRFFKQLNETLIQTAQNRSAQNEETPSEPLRGAESQSAPSACGQPRKQEIDLLLDLRDRMERGIGAAREASAGLTPARLPRLARWLGVGRKYAHQAQEILGALSHGCALTLDRLDEMLIASGVDRIACLNRPFDPQCMTAIDIDETGTAPEGTVVEVYRDGYEWNGTVYRTAQVKVARNTGSQLQ
ncbi:MAG TPA: nucleotide exchange factor GrpE [Terracidiphilus sp.]|nr:nucleotide exchange factor GrpE [Terracidiphilus sp.]